MPQIDLINELGNNISVQAEIGPATYEITTRLIGPKSEAENIITRQEAEALYEVLGRILKADD